MSFIAACASGTSGAWKWKTCHMPSKTRTVASTPAARARSAKRRLSSSSTSSPPTCSSSGGRPVRSATRVDGIAAAHIELARVAQPLPRHLQIDLAVGGMRGTGGGEVGPGRHQHRSARQLRARIAQSDQHREGEAGTGRIAADDDVVGRDALIEQPAIGLERVLDARGKRMLRREPVVGRQHPGESGTAEICGELAVSPGRARRVAAAMQEEEDAVPIGGRHLHPFGPDAAGIDALEPRALGQHGEPGGGLPVAAFLLEAGGRRRLGCGFAPARDHAIDFRPCLGTDHCPAPPRCAAHTTRPPGVRNPAPVPLCGAAAIGYDRRT